MANVLISLTLLFSLALTAQAQTNSGLYVPQTTGELGIPAASDTIKAPVNALPEESRTTSQPAQIQYDVVVVGSEPEGIMAAVAAAQTGARTLLTTQDSLLGGLFVMGEMNSLDLRTSPFNYQQGLFLEWWQRVGKGHSFDVGRAETVFQQMLQEAGVSVRTSAPDLLPYVQDGRVQGVEVGRGSGTAGGVILASQIIDATSEMDFAAAAGAEYTLGFSSLGLQARMADTLVFRIEGINWNELRRGVRERGREYAVADEYVAWGHFGGHPAAYTPEEPDLRLRGLNLGRQEDGSALVNALLIYGVNPFDESSVAEGYARAEREAPRIIDYLKTDLPGFENASYGGVAQKLYIRESRHLSAHCTLSVDDVLNNQVNRFDVAAGGYPLDVQTLTVHDTGFVYGKPDIYGVPLCVNVPKQIDGLWVVGKSAGYDPIAASSARVVPLGMAVGEAVGVAAALATRSQTSPSDFVANERSLQELHSTLASRGAYLPEATTRAPVGPNTDPYYWDYRTLLAQGLAVGGYNNDPNLGETMRSLSYVYLLSNVGTRFLGDSQLGADLLGQYASVVSEGSLTPELALSITRDFACQLGTCLDASWDALKASGLAPQSFPPERDLTRGEMYALAARLSELQSTPVASEQP